MSEITQHFLSFPLPWVDALLFIPNEIKKKSKKKNKKKTDNKWNRVKVLTGARKGWERKGKEKEIDRKMNK